VLWSLLWRAPIQLFTLLILHTAIFSHDLLVVNTTPYPILTTWVRLPFLFLLVACSFSYSSYCPSWVYSGSVRPLTSTCYCPSILPFSVIYDTLVNGADDFLQVEMHVLRVLRSSQDCRELFVFLVFYSVLSRWEMSPYDIGAPSREGCDDLSKP